VVGELGALDEGAGLVGGVKAGELEGRGVEVIGGDGSLELGALCAVELGGGGDTRERATSVERADEEQERDEVSAVHDGLGVEEMTSLERWR
jgi:hypothetical protein